MIVDIWYTLNLKCIRMCQECWQRQNPWIVQGEWSYFKG